MSDDKQLTVAELLARAGKDGSPSEDRPRRRRRRSLEEGGISVAELTGSIPKVKEAPAEARHSSVPIDAPVDAPADAPVDGQREDDAEEADEESPEQPGEESAAPADEAAAAAPEEPEDPEEPEEPEPAGPVAETPEAPEGAEEVSEAVDPQAPATRETTVLGRVEVEEPATGKVGETPGKPAVPGLSSTPVKSAAASAAVLGAATGAEETGQLPTVPETPDETAVADAAEGVDVEEDEDVEDEQVSLGAVLLMALVGIVIGVLVFLGFELLWARFSRLLVGLLALAVTGVMVAAVHAMRTSRDGLSMVLAGLVGLVMTFGPLVVVGL